MEEVTGEPLYRDRVCGIDIGKAGLVAAIRVPSGGNPARRMAETAPSGRPGGRCWRWRTGCGAGRCPRW
ncbi:MAG TPA: hypothetical protein VGL33_04760 [Streptosporangiaceae bacterium]